MLVMHGEMEDNMKTIVDGKEYDVDPCCTSPYENPKNPKYVMVNGYITPVDTIGPHRPWAITEEDERSKDGMFYLASISRGTKSVTTKPLVPTLISLRYRK